MANILIVYFGLQPIWSIWRHLHSLPSWEVIITTRNRMHEMSDELLDNHKGASWTITKLEKFKRIYELKESFWQATQYNKFL